MKTLLKILIFITVPVWFLPVGMFLVFRGLYIGIDEDIDAWFNKRKATHSLCTRCNLPMEGNTYGAHWECVTPRSQK